MTTPKLTHREWVEVYYALEIKRIDLMNGSYGPSIDGDVNIEAWISQLGNIQRKISRAQEV